MRRCQDCVFCIKSESNNWCINPCQSRNRPSDNTAERCSYYSRIWWKFWIKK